MKALTFTKSAVIAGISLLIVAGGASPVQCGAKTCCMMPESGGDLAFQQGPCGCGCGHFEEPQVPDNNAVITAVAEINPIPTKFDYIIENEYAFSGDLIRQHIEREEYPHSPPLIPDNRYTPLLC